MGGGGQTLDCLHCGSSATTERSDVTPRGYRRFRCRHCGHNFHERTGSIFNCLHYLPAVICLVVLWRVRDKLSLRDLAEMCLERYAWCDRGHTRVGENDRLRLHGRTVYIYPRLSGQTLQLYETLDGLEAEDAEGKCYLLRHYRTEIRPPSWSAKDPTRLSCFRRRYTSGRAGFPP